MQTTKKAVILGAMAAIAKVAGLAPDLAVTQAHASDDGLGMCANYGSVCTTGFECCSESCVQFNDGKDRCDS